MNIVEALEKCIDCSNCDACDYVDNYACKEYLLQDAIDTICRQKAENAALHRKLTDAYLMIDRLRGE